MTEAEFRITFDSVVSGLRSLSEAVDKRIDVADVAGVLNLNEYMLFTNLCKELEFWSA